MKKTKMVHGKVEAESVEIKNLDDILGVVKTNKFKRYNSREDYEAALFKMEHRELCEEALRVGETPSAIRELCRNKCLAAWDKTKKTYKYTRPEASKKNLDDIIRGK